MRIHRGAPLELSDFCFGSEMIERQPGNIGYLLAGVRAFAIEDLRDPGFCVARQFCRAAAVLRDVAAQPVDISRSERRFHGAPAFGRSNQSKSAR